MSLRLIQLEHAQQGRRVGVVEEPNIVLLDRRISGSYQLFLELISHTTPAIDVISSLQTKDLIP